MKKCDKRLDKSWVISSGEFCNLSKDVELSKKWADLCKGYNESIDKVKVDGIRKNLKNNIGWWHSFRNNFKGGKLLDSYSLWLLDQVEYLDSGLWDYDKNIKKNIDSVRDFYLLVKEKLKAFDCKQNDCKSDIESTCVINGVGSKKDERLALIRQLLNESWPIII